MSTSLSSPYCCATCHHLKCEVLRAVTEASGRSFCSQYEPKENGQQSSKIKIAVASELDRVVNAWARRDSHEA